MVIYHIYEVPQTIMAVIMGMELIYFDLSLLFLFGFRKDGKWIDGFSGNKNLLPIVYGVV